MAEKPDKFDKPIIVEFAGYGEKVFASASDVVEWAKGEKDFWDKIDGAIQNAKLLPNVRANDLANRAGQLGKRAQNYVNRTEPNDRANDKAAIDTHLAESVDKRLPVSQSRESQQIAALIDENVNAAQLALLIARDGYWHLNKQQEHLLKFPEIPSIMDFMDAWDTLKADTLSAKSALEGQKSSLSGLRSRWERQLAKAENEAALSEEKFSNRTQRLASIAFGRLRKYRALHEQHKKDLAAMSRAFSTDMKLRSAEKMWGKKRRLNRRRANAAFKKMWMLGLGGLIVLLLVFFIMFSFLPPPTEISLTHTIVYILPGLLYVWILRIFANDWKSNKVQADDAEEREAMVLTFKALEYDDKVSDQERLIILSALFRPHGESSEETVPTALLEAITRGGRTGP